MNKFCLMDHSNDSGWTHSYPYELEDYPKEISLNKKSHLCGYIDIEGKYYKCESCQHESIIRQIIFENKIYLRHYLHTPTSFYDSKPRGMLQEEYFAMKRLGFVKISSFRDTPTDMVVFTYHTLTPKQTELIYPT